MITVDQLPAKMRARVRMELCDKPGLAPFCWIWLGGGTARKPSNPQGYGWVSLGATGQLTHRFAYVALVGEIPDGLHIDHLCRNTRCCNPLHLEPVTPRENSHRGIRHTATVCQRDHELSGHNLIIKQGKFGPRRECRKCKYESQRRSVARRQALGGLPAGDPRHGITGYQSYKCKCEICRAAGAEAWQRNPYSAAGKRARKQVAA